MARTANPKPGTGQVGGGAAGGKVRDTGGGEPCASDCDKTLSPSCLVQKSKNFVPRASHHFASLRGPSRLGFQKLLRLFPSRQENCAEL